MRPITANKKLSLHVDKTFILLLQAHFDRINFLIIAFTGYKLSPIIWGKTRRGMSDLLEQIVMYSRLIKYHMRKFREPWFRIIDNAIARDTISIFRIRCPKRNLIHPIRFLQNTVCEPKRLERFHCATRDSISLPHTNGAIFRLDHGNRQIVVLRQVGSEGETRWPRPHDKHIDLITIVKSLINQILASRIRESRVSRLKTIEMKLQNLLQYFFECVRQ